jgi:hypothetical protein
MRARPSHATVVAYLALFVALGGTAGALAGKNSVDSRDIKPKAVRAGDLAKNSVSTPKLKGGAVDTAKIAGNAVTAAKVLDGSIGPPELADDSVIPTKLNLFRSAVNPASVPVTGTSGQSVGPQITLNFPPGALAVFYASANIGTNQNTTDCRLSARFGSVDVDLIDASPDSGNPPLPFTSELKPFLIGQGTPTGNVTATLTATLNGVTTGTCTYNNSQLYGFVIG